MGRFVGFEEIKGLARGWDSCPIEMKLTVRIRTLGIISSLFACNGDQLEAAGNVQMERQTSRCGEAAKPTAPRSWQFSPRNAMQPAYGVHTFSHLLSNLNSGVPSSSHTMY
jgi:hypothetical protein